MGKTQSNVREFALIGFMLLAVLFGMQIMAFIFGNFSVVGASLGDDAITTINETEAWINQSGYTLNGASDPGASTFAITALWNATDNGTGIYNYTILLANVTVSSSGVMLNASTLNFENVSVSYTHARKSVAEILTDRVNNDSLLAIGNYATQSGTQFTTLGVAITLIVLVAVFLFFWSSFMGRRGKSKEGPGGF